MPDAAAAAARVANQPSEGDWNGCFETKLGDHAVILEKLSADAYYRDAVERLASGETVQTVAEWLASLETKGKKGTCAQFLRTFIRLRGYNVSSDDAPILAIYMTTPASELHARAMESTAHYDVLSLGLWVAWNLEHWDKPEDEAAYWEKDGGFKTKMLEYHTVMHGMLVADPRYGETVARLEAGEQIRDVAEWLDGEKGACAKFTKAFVRRFEIWYYPEAAGLTATDANILAKYMSIADVQGIYASAKTSTEIFGVFDIALDAAEDVVEPGCDVVESD
jgi:hypothetical protein